MPIDATAVEVPVARAGFIAANGRPLFVWHHAPPPHLCRGAGIVLCPPIGYEFTSAYRTWRMLAERLAAIGFDTMRLDYDGTGNSTGRDDEPDRVDAWQRSIVCAIAEARRLSPSRAVALVGLRAGALLALRAAAAEGGVDRLVLWGPFQSGRAYIRELKAFARLLRQTHADEDTEAGINAAGHIVTEATVKELERWVPEDITTAPARHVLLVDRDDRPDDPTLANHLERLGSPVTRVRCAGLAELLAPPESAKVPEIALEKITMWFHQWRPASWRTRSRPVPTFDCVPGLAVHTSYREQTVRFGPRGRLFGILTSPPGDIRPAAAIILLNTGLEPHVGPNRLYVPLARELARRHVVLRFDLGGVGDSAAPQGVEENIAYPDHMIDDAREAVAFIRKVAPYSEVIMGGLCSGGWLAFQAAREPLAIDGIISINPPLYLLDGAAWKQHLKEERELARYRQSMRDPSKWMKALHGAASFGTFTRVAANTLARSVALRVGGALGTGLSTCLAQDISAIASRGIRSLFVFSGGDDGLRYFQQHAVAALRRARVREFVRHVVVEGAGHSFSPRQAQRALRELLIDFVASQGRSTAPQTERSSLPLSRSTQTELRAGGR